MMIKSLSIHNFKAIKHLEIAFTPFTVLIGGNSCGKSTVLQALDFIRAFATRDIDEYLHARGWTIEDIESQFSGDNEIICFDVSLVLVIDEKPQNILWRFGIVPVSDAFDSYEMIQNTDTGEVMLSRCMKGSETPSGVNKLRLKSSFLKLVDERKPSEFAKELCAVKNFFVKSGSYELLTPDRMRERSSRGDVGDIGMGGEKLAAYINTMSASQKAKLNRMFSDFIGYAAKTTTETKRPGWVDLFINENFADTKTKIKAAHISDGLLRLLALIAASLPREADIQLTLEGFLKSPENGFVLLDEIEDGVNPYLAEKVISMLRTVVADNIKQVIITTHSPVMVNYFEKDDIVFMWRDKAGEIHAKPMFSTVGMIDTLDCFNPGEVWLNYSRDEILELLNPGCPEGQE